MEVTWTHKRCSSSVVSMKRVLGLLYLFLSSFSCLLQGGYQRGRWNLILPILLPPPVSALQNLITKSGFNVPSLSSSSSVFQIPFFPNNNQKNNNNNKKKKELFLSSLEDELLSLIGNEGQRLSNSPDITRLIAQLEQENPTPEPAIAPQIYGRWKLLYTTNADTSSPIQRNAVNAQKFTIYQDIVVVSNRQKNNRKEDDDDENIETGELLQVNQVVEFSESIRLSVNALASTAAYPLPELTERQGTGKILGLNLLGVSLVGESAKPDPNRPNSRIDFVFDQGQFDFFFSSNNNKNNNNNPFPFLPNQKKKDDTTVATTNTTNTNNDNTLWFQIPYPVPFRWPIFRDAVKGWIDITYLSDRLRIARGNKGTTFVLQKQQQDP